MQTEVAAPIEPPDGPIVRPRWGLGATNTGGPVTYYIDDFTLLRDAQR